MEINISSVHLWTAFFIILYLVWFYRFYLNDANSDWEILGVKIDKSGLFLVSILFIKLLFHIYLYKKGFVIFTGDLANRTLATYKWSLAPHLVPFRAQGWMPFYKYMHGLLFMLADDVIWIPRLTAFLASCVLLVYFFKFIKCIFAERFVPYFAVLILLFHYWHVFASGTPLFETYFMAFFMCGLYYVALWLREDRNIYLFLSSFSFMLASGFHFQVWPVINSVNLVMLYFLVDFCKRKDYRKSGKLVLFFVLNNLWIIIYVLGTFYNTGTMNVFEKHMHRSMTLLTWQNISIFSKLAYYPALVLKNGSLIMWGLLLAGVFHAIKSKKNMLGMSPLLIAAISLIAFSIFNLVAPPSSVKPGRYCIIFIVLLIPHMAYGIDCIFNKRHSAKIRIFSLFVLGLILFSNICRSLNLTGFSKPEEYFSESGDAITAGAYINDILNKSEFGAGSKFIIEKLGSSSLTLGLASKHPRQMMYDRKYIRLIKRNQIPSALRKTPVELREYLLAKNVKYVIVKSEDLKRRFKRLPFALKEKSFGAWTIYKINL